MKKLFAIFGFLVVILIIIMAVLWRRQTSFVISPIGKITEKPLNTYTIDALGKRQFTGGQIMLDDAIATTSAYTTYRFHFASDTKTVTGLAHVPKKSPPAGGFPVIVQFRGFVEREKYFPGEGTRRSSEIFAQNGFITLAPDFLGYGGSASPSADVFEERFETYTTALNLLASVKTLPMADASKMGLWGHSNGGQIALTVLEILGKPLPATLWAPVSKPFPYSILYYTDDFDDHGKALRRRLARFEDDYDVELYSSTNYLDRIVGPLQLHQGSADESVPQKWSDTLVKILKDKRKNATAAADINYFVYSGSDHNLTPAWNTVVSRDVDFFRKYLQ